MPVRGTRIPEATSRYPAEGRLPAAPGLPSAVYGVKSWRVEDPAELGRALRQAIAHEGPSIAEVIRQPLHEARAPVSEWVA